MTPFLLKQLERFMCPRPPKTELEAILLDMTGLSVGKQIHAHAVVKPYDEAVIATGGRGCAGYLLNQVKTAAETGFQDHLTESGMYHVQRRVGFGLRRAASGGEHRGGSQQRPRAKATTTTKSRTCTNATTSSSPGSQGVLRTARRNLKKSR
ncbi:hypothetical protein THAOC_29854, partial [Thalassiosira oceanica]